MIDTFYVLDGFIPEFGWIALIYISLDLLAGPGIFADNWIYETTKHAIEPRWQKYTIYFPVCISNRLKTQNRKVKTRLARKTQNQLFHSCTMSCTTMAVHRTIKHRIKITSMIYTAIWDRGLRGCNNAKQI